MGFQTGKTSNIYLTFDLLLSCYVDVPNPPHLQKLLWIFHLPPYFLREGEF